MFRHCDSFFFLLDSHSNNTQVIPIIEVALAEPRVLEQEDSAKKLYGTICKARPKVCVKSHT